MEKIYNIKFKFDIKQNKNKEIYTKYVEQKKVIEIENYLKDITSSKWKRNLNTIQTSDLDVALKIKMQYDDYIDNILIS